MRAALVVISILAVASQAAFGQTGPYLATVNDPSAALRAGPGQAFDVTSTLKNGDTVLVDHEESGWFAVQDSPGKMYSLSWVPMQFVNFDKNKPIPQNVVVEEDVILAPGLLGGGQPMMNFRRTKVPAGTILTIIGPKASLEGKSWYPVLPPSGDFRYIAKQMVKYDKPVNTSYTIRSSTDMQQPGTPPTTSITPIGSTIPPQPVAVVPAIGSPSAAGTLTGSGSVAPPTPAVNHPLWIQAEAAEKDGRLSDAENLYFQLARSMNEPGGDHDIANMCYTRIHGIREKKRLTPISTTTTAPRPVLTDPTQQGKTTVSTETGGSQRPDFVGTGKLSRSALDVDGKMTYVIYSSPGVPLVYVVAGPGVDLTRYSGKQVNVYGTTSTRRDLSAPLAVATSAEIAS
jgi:hypothetical protein